MPHDDQVIDINQYNGLLKSSEASTAYSGFIKKAGREWTGRFESFRGYHTIPHLTRSALYRCLQRHGISRLPDIEGDKPKRQRCKPVSHRLLSYGHRRGTDRRRELYLFVAIDRSSKFAVTQLVEQPRNRNAAWSRQMRLDMICEANDIEHPLTKPPVDERAEPAPGRPGSNG